MSAYRQLFTRRDRVVRVAATILVLALIATASSLDRSSSSANAAATAGVPAGLPLIPSKAMRVTQPGAVVDARAVDGMIWVLANNVTIRRSRVTNGGYYAIRIGAGITGTLVEDVDIICTSPKGNGMGFSNYTARRVKVTGCKNAFLGSAAVGVHVENSVWDGKPQGTQTANPPASSPSAPTTTPTTKAPTTPTTKAPTTSRSAPPVNVPPPVSTPSTFPNDATTGYKSCGLAASQLRPMSGTIKLTSGQVLENFDLKGYIIANGANITIRCGRITPSGDYGVTTSRMRQTGILPTASRSPGRRRRPAVLPSLRTEVGLLAE